MRASIRLVAAGLVAFGALAVLAARPAAAQYGPPPGPPPGAPAGGYGYQPQPGYGYYPPPPVGVQRQGLTLSVGIGAGSVGLRCDGCSNEEDSEGGPSFTFHIGGSVTPQLALLIDVWGIVFQDSEQTDLIITHNVATVAARYFAGPKFWLQGGIGVSNFQISDRYGGYAEVNDGAAIMGAAGLELHQGYNFTIDLSLRVAVSAFEQTGADDFTASAAALQLGFNWY